MNDYIIRAIAANDQIRAFAAVTTETAADMAQRREDRTAREAEARALEGVVQAQPKKKKSTGAKRSRVTKSAQGIKVSMPSKKKK